MKQRIILIVALVILLLSLGYIIKDLFTQKDSAIDNPYEYNLSEGAELDTIDRCYHETLRKSIPLKKLHNLAIAPDNTVYFGGGNSVLHCTAELEPIDSFFCDGEISAIHISQNEDIIIALEKTLAIFDKHGNKSKSWSGINEISFITGIASTADFIFAADAGNKTVLCYNKNGFLVREIGKKDSISGVDGFFIPSPYFDLLIGRDNELWVVNPGYHQFEAYTFEGRLLTKWNRSSLSIEGFSGCCNPSHIALLPDGSFVTSEKGMVRIKIHQPTGDFKCLIAGPSDFDKYTRGMDLAVNSLESIYIIIPHKRESRVYSLSK